MPEQLSVLHFIRRVRAEDGGVVQAVLDLCRVVADRGHQVTLATFDATDVPTNWRQSIPGTPTVVELLPSRWNPHRLDSRSRDQWASRLRNAHVGHLHTPWEPANLQLSRLLRAARIPYVVTIHGMLDDWCMQQKALKKRAYMALFARKMFRRAAAVHFTAEAEKEQALPWIANGFESVVQACAMDFAPYESLPGPELAKAAFPAIAQDRPRILFLSRVHPKKGLELLLEAGKILHDRKLPIQLLIAGPGEEQYIGQLRTLSNRLGLDGATHFLGMVRGQTKLSVYQWADVFVLPTYQENFGLVLPEAMASGTPVVTTRGTDIWRELQQAGARIADHSPTSIAVAIGELLADDALRSELGRRGQNFVKQWLNVETVTAGYERMYRDAISANSRSAAP